MAKRIDIVSLKQQLADALGENGKAYWEKLQDFLSFKCTKQELDLVALSFFTTPIQVRIHNKLLMAILHNLSPQVANPVGVDQDFVIKNHKKRKGQDLLIGQHLKKRFSAACVLAMTPEEKLRLSTDGFAGPGSSLSSSSSVPSLQDLASPDFTKGMEGIPRSCLEDGDLISRDALKARIKFISGYLGLDAYISEDAVELINQGLE
ncbi:hypothetical protein HDU91_006261, partial [Kappamyces sp. JEL0680]